MNVIITDGESPWQRRHEGDHFKGLLIPFGALCWYKATPPEEKRLPMAESRSIPVIFLGYPPQPGGRWQNDYFVAPLQAFGVNLAESLQGKKASVPIRIVREVIAPASGTERFPLGVAYEKFKTELQGNLTGTFRLNLPSNTDYQRSP